MALYPSKCDNPIFPSQKPTHPAFNIVADRVQSAYRYYSELMSPHLLHEEEKAGGEDS